jgi:hypothetical protein
VLSLGAGVDICAYNFNYDIPKEMFEPPSGANISSNKAASRSIDIFCFRLQSEIQKKFAIRNSTGWGIGGGISILMTPPKDEITDEFVFYENGSRRYFLNRTQYNDNRKKPWLNIHVSLQHDWILKNHGNVGVALKYNYSPIRFMRGTYEFDPGRAAPVTGKYGFAGSYVGVAGIYNLPKRAIKDSRVIRN